MTLLAVDGLTVHFRIRRGITHRSIDTVHAADDVTFSLDSGETLALVGESGSGKTTVAHAVLGLNRPRAGRVIFRDKDLMALPRRQSRAARRGMQVVFQDPYSSLNPRMTVHDLVAEPLRSGSKMKGPELNDRVLTLLEMVGLGTQHLWRRPHEFSGGQCQRIAIARALALQPELLVLDEPTSALDVSVQARILTLLGRIQSEYGLAYLFIAHDLAVVESVASNVAVMYLGKIVESGPTTAIFGEARHPYTLALLASVPSTNPERRSKRAALSGDVPSAIDPPPGCRFHTRCMFRMDVCEREVPRLTERRGRLLACHLADDFDLSQQQALAAAARSTEPQPEVSGGSAAKPAREDWPRTRRHW